MKASSSLRLLLLLPIVALAGCADAHSHDGPAAGNAASALEQARLACWMQVEHDKKAPRDLDKRGKIVDACVAEKTGAQAAGR